MPILKLHAENVGPFEKLELDLSDGNGKAHLGPHILAGVNGSGKTTILRTIAWCLATEESGFDKDGWAEFSAGRTCQADLQFGGNGTVHVRFIEGGHQISTKGPLDISKLGCVATYMPSPALRYLKRPPNRLEGITGASWLSFQGTVSNDHVQAFWIDAFSRDALAKAKGQSNGQSAAAAVATLKNVVAKVLGSDCEPDVNIEKSPMQPVLRFRGIELNFSQLAAGFNATLGWVVDYLARQQAFPWPDGDSAKARPGLILIDEIETHLHPQWQRRVLNGIRAAFPNTQIIVTTHSPFVISSCPEARVHLLTLDNQGKARIADSMDAPAGASLQANTKDVFGIASEFGPDVQKQLDAWNDLKRKQAASKLSPAEKSKLKNLTKQLAAQGEELAFIVSEPPALPESLLDELATAALGHKRR